MSNKRFKPIISKFPHMVHGADYNPEQWIKWKDTIWKEDMHLAKLAGINSLSVGIFSWAMLEPEEGVYKFEFMDEVMDMLAENGMYAVLATPSGARPAWLSHKYEEVLRVDEMRHRNLHGGRHNHCYTSPVYREKIGKLNKMLAERYKDHPALSVWHISNEYCGECFCDLCQEEFRTWLKNKYKTLDNLNEAWWSTFWSHTFTDWSQIEAPSPRGEMSVHALAIDWKRFVTDRFIDFYEHEVKDIRRITPDVPITTNLMYFYDMNYFELGKHLSVASWDSYPQWKGTDDDIETSCSFGFWHAVMRGICGQKPFMLMESSPSATNWRPVAKLYRPNRLLNYSMYTIGHGADTIQYFQYRKSRGSSEKFHGAVIDHEGSENTRVFKDVSDVGEALKKLDDVVGCPVDSKVAVVFDWENRWAIRESEGMLQDKNNYEETVVNHFKSFWKRGIACDVIDQTKELDDYKLVVAPMSYMLREGFAEKVKKFVNSGGAFVLTYMSGYVNDTDLCFLGGFPGPLRDVMGVWCEEIDALYPEDRNEILYNGKSYEAFDMCELIHTEGAAKVLGTFEKDFYAKMPAVTVNEYGRGKAYYVAGRTNADFLDDFYSKVADELGINPCVDYELPEGVNAISRTDGENEYVFLTNILNKPVKVDIKDGGESLLDGSLIKGETVLEPIGLRIYKKK